MRQAIGLAESLAAVRMMFEPGSSVISAFDCLIAYARAAAFRFVVRESEVRSVELQWKDRKRSPFSIQSQANHLNFYLRRPILNNHPGLFEAASARFGSVKPNRLGEYRRHLHTVAEVDEMLQFLRDQGAWPTQRAQRRFVAETFSGVSCEHLLNSARKLVDGKVDHPFGPSTDYELIFEGQRLPPKAVFGIAATEALGFPVKPENFVGGEDTICFRRLRDCGYRIVPKDGTDPDDPPLPNGDDCSWAEGLPRLVTHLHRERAFGLAQAKREQFRTIHGRLFCERCQLDPIETFGSEIGEACIEVHHRQTLVGDMDDGHRTRLEDLECLCANCHRVTHREIKALLRADLIS